MSLLPCLILSLSLTGSPIVGADARPKQPWESVRLSKADAAFLESLLKDFVFDPKGAIRVRVKAAWWHYPGFHRAHLDPRFDPPLVELEGWWKADLNGPSGRVYLSNGHWVGAPLNQVQRVDFVGECKLRIREYLAGRYRRSIAGDQGGLDEPDVVLAAWLYRFGQSGLAKCLLGNFGKGETDELRESLRTLTGQREAITFFQAFSMRADRDAEEIAERVQRNHAEVIRSRFPNFERVRGDLKRRKAKGSFGASYLSGPPKEFADWSVDRRVRFLIDSFDEFDGSGPEPNPRWNEYYPFLSQTAMRYHKDWRLNCLAEIGDLAVPALMDAMDKDDRTTRAFQAQAERRSAGRVQIADVRAIAVQAIALILRTRQFHSREEEITPAEAAVKMRKYWARYGNLPFDERMMAILNDPSCQTNHREEAARNLAHIARAARMEGAVQTRSWRRSAPLYPLSGSRKPPEVLAKFRNPTVAEAILNAMDQDSKPRVLEEANAYLTAIGELGDSRILPELQRRLARIESTEKRFEYAVICRRLGLDGPFVMLGREIASGTLRLARVSAKGERIPDYQIGKELTELGTRILEQDASIGASAFAETLDRHHPFHSYLVGQFLIPQSSYSRGTVLRRPLIVEVLRKSLKDTDATRRYFYLRGTEIEIQSGSQIDRLPLMRSFPNVGDWLENAQETVADLAANRLNEMVYGSPESHPLLKNRQKQLTRLDEFLFRYGRSCRELTVYERNHFNGRSPFSRPHSQDSELELIPVVPPLGRPATEKDVQLGRAIFHLGGKGKAAAEKLPAFVELKSEEANRRSRFGLAVQAETGPDGNVIYGVIFRHDMRAVRADEIAKIVPNEPKRR